MLDLVCLHSQQLQRVKRYAGQKLPTGANTLLRKAFFCHLHQPLFKNCWIIPGSFYRLDQQLNPGTLPKFPMTPETQKVVFIFQRAGMQAQGYISYQISRSCTGSTYFEFSCAKLASRPGKSEYSSAGGGFTLFKARCFKRSSIFTLCRTARQCFCREKSLHSYCINIFPKSGSLCNSDLEGCGLLLGSLAETWEPVRTHNARLPTRSSKNNRNSIFWAMLTW